MATGRAPAGAKPVRWIGRRAYDGRFIAGNQRYCRSGWRPEHLPTGCRRATYCVAGAFALYEGCCAGEHLVNGATITQAEQVERVEYFHIELDGTMWFSPRGRRPRPLSIVTTG